MIKFEKKVDTSDSDPETTLTLDKDQREKSRLKVTLDDGREGGLFFAKGIRFQDGDLILSTDNTTLVQIKAAPETVSTVRCNNPLLLAKACYHLGNRHVPLQIESTVLRYQHDHVLDEMIRGLGLNVITEQAPFEPESGAYNRGEHPHHRTREHSNQSHAHHHD